MNKLKIKKVPITFDEEKHAYTCTLNNELFTGVTTILNVRSKEFLKWWTVKMAVKYLGWFDPKEFNKKDGMEYLSSKLEKIKKFTPEKWYEILTEAKNAHTKRSKEALVAGSIAHDWIESYIKGEKKDTPKDEKAASAIKAFLDWESQHKVEWLASELLVGSMIHKYAGTCDFVANIDGILTLGDFKTSNQISEDVALQTAGYWLALDEMLIKGAKRPEQRAVLRIPKDGKEFEYQRIDTDLEFDKEVFLHLREAHRWNIYIENNFTNNYKVNLQK